MTVSASDLTPEGPGEGRGLPSCLVSFPGAAGWPSKRGPALHRPSLKVPEKNVLMHAVEVPPRGEHSPYLLLAAPRGPTPLLSLWSVAQGTSLTSRLILEVLGNANVDPLSIRGVQRGEDASFGMGTDPSTA